MAAKDLGPLDWRVPIVDGAGKPSPEFQRRWNTQRANNALIGTVTFGTGAPPASPPPDDGAFYMDTTKLPWVLYVGDTAVWNVVGVQDFTDLADVPGNYTSAAGDLVTVNGNATGLVFGNLTSVLDGLGNTTGDLLMRGNATWGAVTIDDVLDSITTTQGSILFRGNVTWEALAPGTAGFVLSTNGTGADPTWVAQSAGPPPSTPHRYWRQLVTATGSGLPVLAECGFMTTIGGSTVTSGGTALADSVFGSFSAAQAFDANPSTDWATSSGGAGVGYIGYDFGSGNDQSIVECYIQASATFTNQAPAAVDLQFSDNGTSWTTLLSGTYGGWSPGQVQRIH